MYAFINMEVKWKRLLKKWTVVVSEEQPTWKLIYFKSLLSLDTLNMKINIILTNLKN